MKPIEQVLTNCIEEIRSGKATVDECLARYPEMRQELEPLLKTAFSIKTPPAYHLEPEFKQSVRANLLGQIRQEKQQQKMSFADIISLGIPRRLAGIRAAVATLAIMLVISMVGSGTAYASQSTVPGDILYPVKISTENVRLLAAGDANAKAELNIEFASKRLEELGKVVNKNEEYTKTVVNRYRRHMEAAIQQLHEDYETSTLIEPLEATFYQIQSHLSTCDNLMNDGPVYIQQVLAADSLAFNGQMQVLEMIARYDGLKATEYNGRMMQERLRQAVTAVDAGNFQKMETDLQQYNELIQQGQQLLNTAETTNNQADQVKKLALQQLVEDLGTLDILTQRVPFEYQNSINLCTRMNEQFQYRARYGRQGQGDNGSGLGDSDGGGNGGFGPGNSTDIIPGQGEVTTDNGNSSPVTSSSDNGDVSPSDDQTGPQNGMGPGVPGNVQGSGDSGPP